MSLQAIDRFRSAVGEERGEKSFFFFTTFIPIELLCVYSIGKLVDLIPRSSSPFFVCLSPPPPPQFPDQRLSLLSKDHHPSNILWNFIFNFIIGTFLVPSQLRTTYQAIGNSTRVAVSRWRGRKKGKFFPSFSSPTDIPGGKSSI